MGVAYVAADSMAREVRVEYVSAPIYTLEDAARARRLLLTWTPKSNALWILTDSFGIPEACAAHATGALHKMESSTFPAECVGISDFAAEDGEDLRFEVMTQVWR